MQGVRRKMTPFIVLSHERSAAQWPGGGVVPFDRKRSAEHVPQVFRGRESSSDSHPAEGWPRMAVLRVAVAGKIVWAAPCCEPAALRPRFSQPFPAGARCPVIIVSWMIPTAETPGNALPTLKTVDRLTDFCRALDEILTIAIEHTPHGDFKTFLGC